MNDPKGYANNLISRGFQVVLEGAEETILVRDNWYVVVPEEGQPYGWQEEDPESGYWAATEMRG